MLLLTEEIGELAKAIRKDKTSMSIDKSKINNYDTIESEVADVFIVLCSICNKLNIKSCVFGYTHLVTGYTRTCFSWLKICSRKCSNSSIIMKDILSNRTIHILCDNEFGYRKLLPSCIFITKQKLNNTKAIVDYSYFSQDYDELVEIYNDNVE